MESHPNEASGVGADGVKPGSWPARFGRAWRAAPQSHAILFLILALAALVFLAASLKQVQLQPGRALPFGAPGLSQDDGAAGGVAGNLMMSLMRGIYGIALVLLPAAIIYLIVSPSARRRLLRDILIFLPLLLLFYVISEAMQRKEARDLQSPEAAPAGGQFGEAGMLPMADFVADPPRWLVWGATMALALLLAGLVFAVVSWAGKRRPREAALERVAQQAEEAAAALTSGADLRDVIVRCYAEMGRVLAEARGIRRAQDMTPREFEIYLEALGLPAAPVHRLTLLFEDVRYGGRQAEHSEGQLAIMCLQSIAQAARRTP